MIRKLLFITSLLMLPIAAQAVSSSAVLSVVVGPSGSVTTPAAAVAAGFTTLALNTDFSAPPSGSWFGCVGAGPGLTWYQGQEGGDYGSQTPCNTNLSSGRITLMQDPLINKQVLNLKFLPSDVVDPGPSRVHYTTIQTVNDLTQGPPNCCMHGVVFPSNYYMEATYRVENTPNIPFNRMTGLWWAFWQGGEGTPPGSRDTLEVDHPEQHGEDPGEIGDNVINWHIGGGEGFPAPYGPRADTTDFTKYQTWGVRSVTSGDNITFCGYLNNNDTGCNTYALGAGQSTERKFMILFVGLQCFYFGPTGGAVTHDCINKPVSLYQCGTEICVQSPTDILRRIDHDYYFYLANVTGGTNNPNGSWPASSTGDLKNWRLVGSQWGGPYSSGLVNPTQGVDMKIQNVRVWSCSSWQSTNC